MNAENNICIMGLVDTIVLRDCEKDISAAKLVSASAKAKGPAIFYA